MSANTHFTLDARQRAMLEEMHIKVWQPKLAAPPAAPAAAAATASEVIPKKIADSAVPERAAAVLDLKTLPRHATVAQPLPGVAQMDWPTLAATVANCQACKLCESRKHPVFGAGQPPAGPGLPPRVDWLIVGEAPGEHEDLQGEPFVGQAGQLLDNMLRAMQLERQHNVFITNVLKCRPPANRNPEPTEVAQCAPYLQRQIELLQPKLILAMGRFAVQALLQTSEPIGKLRGRPHQYHGVPVVVTYHPAYLLRNLPDKAKAWADLCLALSLRAKLP